MKKKIVLGIVIIVIVVFSYCQNNIITTSFYTFSTEKMKESTKGYRVVQVSDLHNKMFGKNQHKILDKIRGLKPDCIVITGDIIDSNHTNIENAIQFAKGATLIAPVYYVTGNHEAWLSVNDLQKLKTELEEAGVTLLENEIVTLKSDSDCIHLVGLNDSSLLGTTLEDMKLNENDFNVLLAHEPQYISNYASQNIDFVFAGHAHGGQFILPFIGGIYAPDQGFNPTYYEGLYKEKNTTMVVSRGLGNSIIPIRLFNYPEIVCVTFN